MRKKQNEANCCDICTFGVMATLYVRANSQERERYAISCKLAIFVILARLESKDWTRLSEQMLKLKVTKRISFSIGKPLMIDERTIRQNLFII